MTSWEHLLSVYPEYSRRMAAGGVRGCELDEAGCRILVRALYGERCGVVEAEVSVYSEGMLLVTRARVARSAVGNRGWAGGSLVAGHSSVRESVRVALAWMSDVRDLLR